MKNRPIQFCITIGVCALSFLLSVVPLKAMAGAGDPSAAVNLEYQKAFSLLKEYLADYGIALGAKKGSYLGLYRRYIEGEIKDDFAKDLCCWHFLLSVEVESKKEGLEPSAFFKSKKQNGSDREKKVFDDWDELQWRTFFNEAALAEARDGVGVGFVVLLDKITENEKHRNSIIHEIVPSGLVATKDIVLLADRYRVNPDGFAEAMRQYNILHLRRYALDAACQILDNDVRTAAGAYAAMALEKSQEALLQKCPHFSLLRGKDTLLSSAARAVVPSKSGMPLVSFLPEREILMGEPPCLPPVLAVYKDKMGEVYSQVSYYAGLLNKLREKLHTAIETKQLIESKAVRRGKRSTVRDRNYSSRQEKRLSELAEQIESTIRASKDVQDSLVNALLEWCRVTAAHGLCAKLLLSELIGNRKGFEELKAQCGLPKVNMRQGYAITHKELRDLITPFRPDSDAS